MIGPFEAPIPGESLTTTPKNAPYESPPRINDPEEAIELHLDNLSNPNAMEAALELLESKTLTLVDLVNGLMRVAVAHGQHSVDVSLLIAPVVHEFIKQTANAVGVEFDEGFVNEEAAQEDRRKRAAALAKKQIKEMGFETPEVNESAIDEVTEETKEEVQEQTTRGLMSREAE